jgi:hypothetical protein
VHFAVDALVVELEHAVVPEHRHLFDRRFHSTTMSFPF